MWLITMKIPINLLRATPKILTGFGVLGVPLTAILSVIGHERAKKRSNEKDILKYVKETWVDYLPGFLMGVATIGSIISGQHIALQRAAISSAAYSLAQDHLLKYQAKTKEIVGHKKELDISDALSQDQVNLANTGQYNKSKEVIIVSGKGEVLFLDAYTNNYFMSDMNTVKQAVNNFNFRLNQEMFLSLNEFFDDLGLPAIPAGDKVGWDVQKGLLEIRYSTTLTSEGTPCVVLNYFVEPKYL